MKHHEVRVLDRRGTHLALELRTLHPDAGVPSDSAAFALELLLDQWQRMVWRFDVHHDFAHNLATAAALPGGSPWDHRLEPLHALAFRRERAYRGRVEPPELLSFLEPGMVWQTAV